MRIHTNDVGAVLEGIRTATRGLEGVYAETSRHGSRSHAGSIELSLEGTSTRRKNSGFYGAASEYDGNAATWDEWGVVLQAVFVADPLAVAGTVKNPTYAGREHYEWVTGARFVDGMPSDTHQQHRFNFQGEAVTGSFYAYGCSKCSAHTRRLAPKLPGVGWTAREILEGATIFEAVHA